MRDTNLTEQEPQQRAVYTARDIAQITGLSMPSVYELMNRADFPTVVIGQRRRFVPIESFHRWLENQTMK